MSARPPQYWLEYTFPPSEQSPPILVSNTIKALKEATREAPNVKLLFLFKVLAEPKVIAVIQAANAAELEGALAAKTYLGNLAVVQCLPLRPYEAFAEEVLGVHMSYRQNEIWANVPGDFYWITVDVNYKGLTQEELFKIWKEEAKAALGVMEQGTAKLFKVVAENKVMILLKMPTPDVVDNTFNTGLPLFKQLGNQVTTSCRLVVSHQDPTPSPFWQGFGWG